MTTLYVYAKSPSKKTHEWYIYHPQLGKIRGNSIEIPTQANVDLRLKEICRQEGIDRRDLEPLEVTETHKIYGEHWDSEGYQR